MARRIGFNGMREGSSLLRLGFHVCSPCAVWTVKLSLYVLSSSSSPVLFRTCITCTYPTGVHPPPDNHLKEHLVRRDDGLYFSVVV
jgi:hypothetical protein